MPLSRTLSACLAALVLAVPASADWPEFRGPAAQGRYAGKPLPTAWSADKNIAWRAPIDGLGWSSPAVVAGRVYLTTAVPADADHSLRALCLDAATGKELWNREVFRQDGKSAPRPHTKNSHASPSPVVRDGRLFVHFGHQGTACLDLDGEVVWTNREQKYPPVHGNGGSPLVADGLVIFSCDGASGPYVAALDASTGKLRWKTERSWDSVKKFAFCTPLRIEANGAVQVVIPGAGGVAAYDPRDGSEIWKAAYEGYSVVPRPVFGHGMVYFSTGYDTAQLLAVRVDGRGDVTESHIAWTARRAAPHNPSPVLAGDLLFTVSDQGQASCFDARTGKAHWQERIPGAYSASLLLAGDLLYATNEQGLTTVLKAETAFQVVGRNPLGERALASAAAVDGALFLRTENALYRIENRR